LTLDELRVLTDALTSTFPTHALVHRCVDRRESRVWGELGGCGYEFIMNRPVHEWDPGRLSELRPRQLRSIKRDIALLAKSPLSVREPLALSEAESQRVESCYLDLYVGKHSALNAQFTAEYFRSTNAAGFVKIALFERKDTHEIAGFVTSFEDTDRVVSSLVGYDAALPIRKFPSYRMAFGVLADACIKRDRKLFLSTGAASFKLNRGTYEWMEYEAFFVRHLPRYRQAAWKTLAKLINFAGTHLDSSQI
jgi:hypothetical protein